MDLLCNACAVQPLQLGKSCQAPGEDGIRMMSKEFIWPSCEDPSGVLSMNCPARLRADYVVIEYSAEGAP